MESALQKSFYDNLIAKLSYEVPKAPETYANLSRDLLLQKTTDF